MKTLKTVLFYTCWGVAILVDLTWRVGTMIFLVTAMDAIDHYLTITMPSEVVGDVQTLTIVLICSVIAIMTAFFFLIFAPPYISNRVEGIFNKKVRFCCKQCAATK